MFRGFARVTFLDPLKGSMSGHMLLNKFPLSIIIFHVICNKEGREPLQPAESGFAVRPTLSRLFSDINPRVLVK
jgi:hypothetical protein